MPRWSLGRDETGAIDCATWRSTTACNNSPSVPAVVSHRARCALIAATWPKTHTSRNAPSAAINCVGTDPQSIMYVCLRGGPTAVLLGNRSSATRKRKVPVTQRSTASRNLRSFERLPAKHPDTPYRSKPRAGWFILGGAAASSSSLNTLSRSVIEPAMQSCRRVARRRRCLGAG